jgi:hypothetical protein
MLPFSWCKDKGILGIGEIGNRDLGKTKMLTYKDEHFVVGYQPFTFDSEPFTEIYTLAVFTVLIIRAATL